ncbi:MAG: hypothetical protein RL095_222 [Verrucomicrobiota bacterium]|jgi:2-oxoglutarate dehydrogenase E2 component (dihydrolipoamide succinyltransferase)
MSTIIDITVPKAGESVNEADIARWLKADGDIVKLDEALCELETSKASLPINAPAAGRLKIITAAGTTCPVGMVVAQIDTSAAGAAAAPAKAKEPVRSAESTVMDPGMPSPSARRLLAENEVSAQDVKGSGPDGRIIKADVINHLAVREKELKMSSTISGQLAAQKAAVPAASCSAPASSSALCQQSGRAERREKMSRLRRTIAERLVEAQNTAVICTTFNEVDMSAIMELRKKYKEKFTEKHQVGIGFMSFFAKAAASALKEFPILNASVDGNDIVYHDFVDIGIAVATPKGLVVPIIRDIDQMNFAQIEKAIAAYGAKGKAGGITIEDMTGGTFTITNGGTFGSMLSTPIINRPQSAILGMHNIVERPVAVNGQVVIRPIMYLAVSYDHRIIDGADAVKFLVKIKTLLEDPSRILLDL